MRNYFMLCVMMESLVAIAAAPAAAQNQLWMRQFGIGVRDEARALCPDGAGGAFVAGLTGGSLGGPNAGLEDAWVARYDSAGNRTWIRQFGTSDIDFPDALCPDGAGGAFAAGSTSGSLAGPYAGGFGDAWLARYDSAGNQTWVRQFGGSETDYAHGLCPDGAGGAFVAGVTSGSLGGPNAGGVDAWLARYDSAGNQTWIRQLGPSAAKSPERSAPTARAARSSRVGPKAASAGRNWAKATPGWPGTTARATKPGSASSGAARTSAPKRSAPTARAARSSRGRPTAASAGRNWAKATPG